MSSAPQKHRVLPARGRLDTTVRSVHVAAVIPVCNVHVASDRHNSVPQLGHEIVMRLFADPSDVERVKHIPNIYIYNVP